MKHKIDCEPKWVDLIPILVGSGDRAFAIRGLRKIAVIADKIRQAEKNKEKIEFDFTEDSE